MIPKVQWLAKRLGEGGCKFLSLLAWCEVESGMTFDPIVQFANCLRDGFVGDDGFVKNTEAIMTAYCGGRWKELWAGNGVRSNGTKYDLPLDYACAAGEYDVLRYERPADKSLGETEAVAHFVRGDGKGKLVPGGDPWGNSRTCREGKLISRRILRRLL